MGVAGPPPQGAANFCTWVHRIINKYLKYIYMHPQPLRVRFQIGAYGLYSYSSGQNILEIFSWVYKNILQFAITGGGWKAV
jgi:hypothetical protein